MLVHQVPLQDVVEVLTTEVVPGGQDLGAEMIVARLGEALRQGEDAFAFVFLCCTILLSRKRSSPRSRRFMHCSLELAFYLNNGHASLCR